MHSLWGRPVVVDTASGSHFTDVDGNEYVDFALGVTISSAGHTHPAIVDAVTDRIRGGIQFALPTEDAIAVSEELARRFAVPRWLYALSSTQAMVDVIRLARLATGRPRIVVFDGKYHGHLSETLVVLDDRGAQVAEYDGIASHDVARTIAVPWNDLAAVEAVLAREDVALLIAEPALTNSQVVLPDPGFHDGLRDLCTASGTLLAIDETQTLPCAFGGLTRAWGLKPDFVVLGKSLGGGVPVAAYGMPTAVAALVEGGSPQEAVGVKVSEPGIGGTMFGNALSLAAARAALEYVWTEEGHLRTTRYAWRIADGMRDTLTRHGLDWPVYHLGNRAGYHVATRPPRTNRESIEADDHELRALQHVYFANRGIWDMGWWCGPAVSAQTTTADVDRYVAVFSELFDDLAS